MMTTSNKAFTLMRDITTTVKIIINRKREPKMSELKMVKTMMEHAHGEENVALKYYKNEIEMIVYSERSESELYFTFNLDGSFKGCY